MITDFFTCHAPYKSWGEPLVTSSIPVPDDLLQLLTKTNVSSYSNGFFMFVPPLAFQDIFLYFNLSPAECFPFLKSAFGMLIFYHGTNYKLLDPIANEIILLAENDDSDFLLNVILCDRVGLENTFLIHLYEQAIEKISPPGKNECFAFMPAIRMGGSFDINTIQKVAFRPELAILSQL